MIELSFLVAQGLAVAALLLLRRGLENSDLGICLAVLVPSLVVQAAILLPRVTGPQASTGECRRRVALAWVLAVVFAGLAWWLTYQFARKDLLTSVWSLALTLGTLEALYGVYAVWFLQSRVIASQRQVTALRERLAQQREFDVFLCHNSRDKADVKAVALELLKRGLKPWLDEWELRPGTRWQLSLEEQIKQVKSAAVFVGAEGIGPWQSEEIGAFLSACVRRGIPVIPVVLPNAGATPDWPPFLEQRMWVDFRQADPDPLEQLVFGIVGRLP
jgi:hypothetical protein